MAEWRFRRMQPGEMNIDPIEGEFFSTEALDSLTDALVREAIQNSLDARRGDAPVRIRIAFGAAEPSLASAYFDGLWPHLEAGRSGLAELPRPESPLEHLLIEDFGTRGLQGDPAQSEDEQLGEEGARNDFYYFWRNVGRTRKAASDLGRWGLGKTVFPAASRINSFLALTVRADDARRLLMGQSVLRIHKVEGARYYPYGYFASFREDFAEPLDEAAALDRFTRAFRLARASGEPGLSVLVPWPDPEITPERAIASVLRHYFVPILAGELEVEIAGADGAERLDAATLPRVLTGKGRRASGISFASPAERARFAGLMKLAQFAHTLPRTEHHRLPGPAREAAPRWVAESLDELPGELRRRFDAGLPVAFTIPVWVKRAPCEPVLSAFDLYIERDEALSRAEEHFVREGITIAGVRGTLPKGMRAIVIAREAPLAALLGDAENPAHTEWQERSPKFRHRYRHGPFTLRYVRNAPREIARALTRAEAGRNARLLEHLFSLEVPTEEAVIDLERARADEPGEGKSRERPSILAGDGARHFQLHKLAGGFRLVGTGNGHTPRQAALRVAYEVRRGNPFAQYQPPDFDLGRAPISVRAEHATVLRQEGNRMVLAVEDPRFRLSVEGFDPHRDIRVRVETLAEEGRA